LNRDDGAITDAEVRIAAFDWLRQNVEMLGDVLPRDLLARGFEFQGIRVPLVGPQGIFKPKVLASMPLSITTAPPGGPYDDGFGEDGLLAYKYRGDDPNHHDNVGLREAMRRRAPLVYFHGLVPGRYLASWPAFVVGDDPGGLTFRVAVDDASLAQRAAEDAGESPMAVAEDSQPRRAYVTAVVRRRLHQRAFRERVLAAYKQACALCRLRHVELLGAAHIIPDGEPGGEPSVNNGIALCALHHLAFDRFLIGIRPDCLVEVRPSILREHDGPMLLHGLQGLQGAQLAVPGNPLLRPGKEFLEWRWERFTAVA